MDGLWRGGSWCWRGCEGNSLLVHSVWTGDDLKIQRVRVRDSVTVRVRVRVRGRVGEGQDLE